MKDIKLFKSNLRDKYKGMRGRMDIEDKRIIDEKITSKVVNLAEYNNTKIILIYISKNIEVSTYDIIRDAWSKGKNIGVPKCNIENMSMEFYYINSFDDVERGAFGLYEPINHKCSVVDNFSDSICIVPGFCFDVFGYRLGYGHGYYDRFLSGFTGIKIGVCYNEYVKTRLPRGRYDKPIDILVTDRYIKNISKQ